MPVLAVLNQKGGVGKTTLSLHIAAELAAQGARILLVDADPQHSSLDWAGVRQAQETPPAFAVVGIPNDTLHAQLPQLSRGYDWTIIDGPARVYNVSKSAIVAADVVLVPVQPAGVDIWAADDMVKLIREVQIVRERLKGAFVINRNITHTTISRDAPEALGALPLPLLKTAITQRVAYVQAMNHGLTVQDTEPTGPAAADIRALVNEVKELAA